MTERACLADRMGGALDEMLELFVQCGLTEEGEAIFRALIERERTASSIERYRIYTKLQELVDPIRPMLNRFEVAVLRDELAGGAWEGRGGWS